MNLRLFGTNFTVTLQRPDDNSALRNGLWGHTNFGLATIHLSDEPVLSVRDGTLLHEIIHVCDHVGNLRMKEPTVAALADLLYAALADNDLWKPPWWD